MGGWREARCAGALSPATTMRALAALLTLAACSRSLHAHAQSTPPSILDDIPRVLSKVYGLSESSPIQNLITCTQSLGLTKCISAFSAWRAENALENLDSGFEARSNVIMDVKDFPWKQFKNTTDDEVYAQLCYGTEKLLRYKSLSLNVVPGYTLALESKGNGTLNVDVLRKDESDSRNMKKLQKRFYGLVPLLLLPGLVMSAILPFMLPALKLMTVFAGMINNMALSGAVFTLLRNNAFNDHYEKKVIYVNEGYKNEKHAPVYFKDVPLDHVNLGYSASDLHAMIDANPAASGGGFALEGYPTDEQWLAQYYGEQAALKKPENSQRKSSRTRVPKNP